MRITAVHPGQACKRVAALDELVRLLAEGHALLGDRLVERHGGTAAAMPEQHDLRDTRHLRAQVVHAGFHVERVVLPWGARRLVVVAARVHPEHDEAARGQLHGADVVQVVRVAVHDDHTDVRAREERGIGTVQRALRRAGELHVDRLGRGGEGRSGQRQRACKGKCPCDSRHRCLLLELNGMCEVQGVP
jgi:hypothetical protein